MLDMLFYGAEVDYIIINTNNEQVSEYIFQGLDYWGGIEQDTWHYPIFTVSRYPTKNSFHSSTSQKLTMV